MSILDKKLLVYVTNPNVAGQRIVHPQINSISRPAAPKSAEQNVPLPNVPNSTPKPAQGNVTFARQRSPVRSGGTGQIYQDGGAGVAGRIVKDNHGQERKTITLNFQLIEVRFF